MPTLQKLTDNGLMCSRALPAIDVGEEVYLDLEKEAAAVMARD